jgi:hypothetical protein
MDSMWTPMYHMSYCESRVLSAYDIQQFIHLHMPGYLNNILTSNQVSPVAQYIQHNEVHADIVSSDTWRENYRSNVSV